MAGSVTRGQRSRDDDTLCLGQLLLHGVVGIRWNRAVLHGDIAVASDRSAVALEMCPISVIERFQSMESTHLSYRVTI